MLVEVQASSEQLIGQGTFKTNSRFTSLWDQRLEKIVEIEKRLESAVALATLTAANTRLALKHF